MNGDSKSISRYYRSIKPEYSKIYNDKEMAYLGIAHLPLILGLTGPTKSGKTMVAKYLVTNFGFHYECLSSYIRERAIAFGYTSPNWEKMRDIAKQWRVESGPAILVKVLVQKLEREGVLRNARTIVIDGILHPMELLTLQKLPNSHFIAISATPEFRYKSTVEWAIDPPNWEDFIRRDQWERGFRENGQEPGEEEPNIDECIRLTPKENQFELTEGKGSKEELFNKIHDFLKKVRAQSL